MKRYIARSVKYFVTFVALVLGLLWVQSKWGASPVPFEALVKYYFEAWNGWALAGASVLLSATYPLFGYTTRRIKGDIKSHREAIVTAMEAMGMTLVGEERGEMKFRAGIMQRITSLFEDEITIRQNGEDIEVEGLRRLSVRLAYRLEGYLSHFNRENEA